MGLFKRIKNTNKPLIRQILDLVPPWLLQNCIAKHNSDKGCSRYMTIYTFIFIRYKYYKLNPTTKLPIDLLL